ncbi:hypothetical protein LCGC14_2738030, partial [marine sediment metagenome]
AKPIRVTLQYRVVLPPPAPTTAPAMTSAPATASAPATPPVKYRTGKIGPLMVAKIKDHSYVWVHSWQPLAVGELGEDFYDKLAAEFRNRDVLKVDADKVAAFTLAVADAKMSFGKSGDKWSLTDDRHVKIDADKVKEFLKALDFKAASFVDYADKPDLKRFGLDAPAIAFQTTGPDGKTAQLSVSRTGPVGSDGRYATGGKAPGVFVLDKDAVKKLQKELKDFQK